METKNFLGLDGLKRFWTKAKLWIINEITTKIAEIVAEAPEDLDTLKEISDWISTHKDSASAMNSNIIKNQSDINELNNKLSSIEQTNFKAIFDLVRPIGDTYVQYPQQASPMELWGSFSTWNVVNYDGAFFRAEGTNAAAFIEEGGNLVKQADAIKTHNTGGMSANAKGHIGYGIPSQSPYASGNVTVDNHRDDTALWGSNHNYLCDGYDIDVSHIHTYYGAAETRPQNYTVRIWKRTA